MYVQRHEVQYEMQCNLVWCNVMECNVMECVSGQCNVMVECNVMESVSGGQCNVMFSAM